MVSAKELFINSVSPLGGGIRSIVNAVKREQFQDQPNIPGELEPPEEENSSTLIIVYVLVVIMLIVMCVCWYNILPDDFMKPLHIILLLFVSGLYLFCFLIYVGLITKYTLVKDKKVKK